MYAVGHGCNIADTPPERDSAEALSGRYYQLPPPG